MSKPATKPATNGDQGLSLEARVIQCIAKFKAPGTTQDALDVMAAEFATANYIRMHAEKRYNEAKLRVVDEYADRVADVKSKATQDMMKATLSIAGGDWRIEFAANKPAMRTDVDELRTELIKRGVHVDTIDAAINKVSKRSSPALTVSAKPME